MMQACATNAIHSHNFINDVKFGGSFKFQDYVKGVGMVTFSLNLPSLEEI